MKFRSRVRCSKGERQILTSGPDQVLQKAVVARAHFAASSVRRTMTCLLYERGQ
jgi:hypothetical protein